MREKVSRVGIVAIVLALSLATGCSRLGFGRNDAQIADEVRGKIYADASISTKQIAVESKDGVVTLTGTVGNESERNAAAADASQVAGVKTVVNNLQVAAAPAPAPAAETASAPPPPPKATRRRSTAAPTGVDRVTIPEGTRVLVRMIDAIDSEKNKLGDTFRASLEAPITVNGDVVVPKNANVEGRIVEAKSAGHFTGRSEIALELVRIVVNGRSYEIQTNQFTRAGGSRGKRTAATVGGGAALGAIIGGVAGGGKGAAIGAAAGAGAGTAVQAVTKGEQIRIPSETVLEFELTAPARVR